MALPTPNPLTPAYLYAIESAQLRPPTFKKKSDCALCTDEYCTALRHDLLCHRIRQKARALYDEYKKCDLDQARTDCSTEWKAYQQALDDNNDCVEITRYLIDRALGTGSCERCKAGNGRYSPEMGCLGMDWNPTGGIIWDTPPGGEFDWQDWYEGRDPRVEQWEF